MADRRKKNLEWCVADENGSVHSKIRDGCTLAVLMDIRDELKRLNNVFHCVNFMNVPFKLDRIAKNTSKPKKRKAK